MRRGSLKSWEPSLPLISSSRLLCLCHTGGGKKKKKEVGEGGGLPNEVPGQLFNRANCLTFTVPPSQLQSEDRAHLCIDLVMRK